MKKYYVAKLTMYRSVNGFFDIQMPVVASVPALLAGQVNFKAKLSNIESTAALEDEVLTGITTDKKVMKKLVVNQFYENGSMISAYAAGIKDHTLQESVTISISDLNRKNYKELISYCGHVRNMAMAHIEALKDYGMDGGAVPAMDAMLASYGPVTVANRNAVSTRRTYKLALERQIEDMDIFIETVLDKLVARFRSSNPNFYNGYKFNRSVIDPQTSGTQLKGTIDNSITGKAVAGVTVTAVFNNNVFTTRTDAFGNYVLKIPVPGIYTVVFTHPGYEDADAIVIEIKLGKKRSRSLSLKPVAK